MFYAWFLVQVESGNWLTSRYNEYTENLYAVIQASCWPKYERAREILDTFDQF
jgi:hypothetical protein